MTLTAIALAAAMTVVTAVAPEQAPATTPAPAPASAPAKPAAPGKPPVPVEQPTPTIDPAYVYEPAGRRDPFISLVGRGDDKSAPAIRPAGLAGLLIGEITVKGVVRDRNGFTALLQAPDNKTYNVRTGDKLFDGSVKSINQEKVIFSQDVSDPLSLVKQREVSKPVRQADGRG
jgi:Tfp pilus assembly protein PilP